ELGDDPGMGQRGRGDQPLAFADEQLEAKTAILGRGDRDPPGRQDGDVAAVAAAIEHAKAPALAGAEIEGMLDDRPEPGGFHRKGIVALIAERCAGALLGRGMVVLVIGQPLAGPQIALPDARRIAIGRAYASQHIAARVKADILDHEIADCRWRRDDLARRGSGGLGRRCRDQQRGSQAKSGRGDETRHSGNSSSIRTRNVLGSVSPPTRRRYAASYLMAPAALTPNSRN